MKQTLVLVLCLLLLCTACGGNATPQVPASERDSEDVTLPEEQEEITPPSETSKIAEEEPVISETNLVEEASVGEETTAESITILVTPATVDTGLLPSFYIENEATKQEIIGYLQNLGDPQPHNPFSGAQVFSLEVTRAGETIRYGLTSEKTGQGSNVLGYNNEFYHVPADFWQLMVGIYPDLDLTNPINLPVYSVSLTTGNQKQSKSAGYGYFIGGLGKDSENTKISSDVKNMLDSLTPTQTIPNVENIAFYEVTLDDKSSPMQDYWCYENGYVQLQGSGQWYRSAELYHYVDAILGT